MDAFGMVFLVLIVIGVLFKMSGPVTWQDGEGSAKKHPEDSMLESAFKKAFRRRCW